MQPLKRWNVGELTRYVRQMFETDYRLQDLEVEGEISNWRVYDSGHAYFTLKDAEAQLRAVMWHSDVLNQPALPHDGDRVVARGRLAVYEARGEYQLIARLIQPAGIGDLYARFEELKAKLEAEGLFDEGRKRPLPEYIHTVGIVTSPGAAALQDVRTVLARRNPLIDAILSPTLVQGSEAPPQIAAALGALNAREGIDVILVVRGGGSLEDLWCFNDERVVRAVAASGIPVVSGVGHEVDFTLTDFAADLRAPTPSAAAELVTPLTLDDFRAALDRAARDLSLALQADLGERRRGLDHLSRSLHLLSPQSRLDSARQRIDGLLERASRAARGDLRLRREKLSGRQTALLAMNPLATLARGYAIVRDAGGQVLRRAAEAAPGSKLDIRLHDGALRATVDADSQVQSQ